MSGNIRGASVLFPSGTAVDDSGLDSNPGFVGPMTNVAVLLSNEGADPVTFDVQVAGGPPAAGMNPDLSTANWYDLYDESDGSKITLDVPAGAMRAFDLSPFAPPYIRLHAIAIGEGATTTVEALIVANG